jgi:hypothetical protein
MLGRHTGDEDLWDYIIGKSTHWRDEGEMSVDEGGQLVPLAYRLRE